MQVAARIVDHRTASTSKDRETGRRPGDTSASIRPNRSSSAPDSSIRGRASIGRCEPSRASEGPGRLVIVGSVRDAVPANVAYASELRRARRRDRRGDAPRGVPERRGLRRLGERRGPAPPSVHPRLVLRSAGAGTAARDPGDRVRRGRPREQIGPEDEVVRSDDELRRCDPAGPRIGTARRRGSLRRGAGRSAVSRAVSSQLNVRGPRGPAARSRSRSAVSVSRRSMPAAMSSMSCGSTSSAASPAVSGSAETFDVRTGVPQAIASRTGSPNPSYSDGYTSASAPAEQRHLLLLRDVPGHDDAIANPRQGAPRAPAARGPTPPGSMERRAPRSPAPAARRRGGRRRRGSGRGGSCEARSRRARGGTAPRSRTGDARASTASASARPEDSVSTPSGTTVSRSARRAATPDRTRGGHAGSARRPTMTCDARRSDASSRASHRRVASGRGLREPLEREVVDREDDAAAPRRRGDEVRREQHVEPDHPFEPRDVETQRHAVEPPRRQRHPPFHEVRRPDVLEQPASPVQAERGTHVQVPGHERGVGGDPGSRRTSCHV